MSLRNVEMEAMARKVRVLKETDVRRQRKKQLDQEEIDKNRRELQKAQLLQVSIYLSRLLCAENVVLTIMLAIAIQILDVHGDSNIKPCHRYKVNSRVKFCKDEV